MLFNRFCHFLLTNTPLSYGWICKGADAEMFCVSDPGLFYTGHGRVVPSNCPHCGKRVEVSK